MSSTAGCDVPLSKYQCVLSSSRGVSAQNLPFVGFDGFTKFMESKIEVMFAQAITPVLKKVGEYFAKVKK